MPKLVDEVAIVRPVAGEYNYSCAIVTGPVVFQYSPDNGVTWVTYTDGSIAASADGVIKLNAKWQFRAQIPGGDSAYLEMTERGTS